MKKVICDFCKKQTESSTEYVLPCMCPIDAKNRYGVTLVRFGYEVCDDKKDVCPECKEKIASLLELLPRVKYENDDRTRMALVWDE